MHTFSGLPWIGPVVGIVGILIGVAVAYYFYIRSIRSGQLVCQWDGVTVVDADDPESLGELTVQYKNTPVRRLTITEIVIWNAGDKTVRGEDLVASDPLAIRFDNDSEILEIETIRVTRDAIGATVLADTGPTCFAKIEFAFLDPGDGFTLRIAHTGRQIAPIVTGTIIGSPSGVVLWGRTSSESVTRGDILERLKLRHGRLTPLDHIIAYVVPRRRTALIVMIVLGLLMMLTGLLRPVLENAFPALFDRSDESTISGSLIVVGLMYLALPCLWFWMRRRRYPTILDPRE